MTHTNNLTPQQLAYEAHSLIKHLLSKFYSPKQINVDQLIELTIDIAAVAATALGTHICAVKKMEPALDAETMVKDLVLLIGESLEVFISHKKNAFHNIDQRH